MRVAFFFACVSLLLMPCVDTNGNPPDDGCPPGILKHHLGNQGSTPKKSLLSRIFGKKDDPFEQHLVDLSPDTAERVRLLRKILPDTKKWEKGWFRADVDSKLKQELISIYEYRPDRERGPAIELLGAWFWADESVRQRIFRSILEKSDEVNTGAIIAYEKIAMNYPLPGTEYYMVFFKTSHRTDRAGAVAKRLLRTTQYKPFKPLETLYLKENVDPQEFAEAAKMFRENPTLLKDNEVQLRLSMFLNRTGNSDIALAFGTTHPTSEAVEYQLAGALKNEALQNKPEAIEAILTALSAGKSKDNQVISELRRFASEHRDRKTQSLALKGLAMRGSEPLRISPPRETNSLENTLFRMKDAAQKLLDIGRHDLVPALREVDVLIKDKSASGRLRTIELEKARKTLDPEQRKRILSYGGFSPAQSEAIFRSGVLDLPLPR